MSAAQHGHAATVQALLKAGANCNLQNEAGLTALKIAIANQRDDIVKLLRSHLANKQPKRNGILKF